MYPGGVLPNNSVQALADGRDQWSQGGVSVRYLELNGVRPKFQVITIPIDKGATRYPFEQLALTTNDRIIGVSLISDERGPEEDKYINSASMQLTIDNEEVLPDGFRTSMIAAKIGNGFYDNMYRINERADGAQIKGNITINAPKGEVVPRMNFQLYLWSLTKPKKI